MKFALFPLPSVHHLQYRLQVINVSFAPRLPRSGIQTMKLRRWGEPGIFSHIGVSRVEGGQRRSDIACLRDQILEQAEDSLLVAVLQHAEADPSLIPEQNSSLVCLIDSGM